jgi:hypothetical protein
MWQERFGERACCPFFDIDMRLEREGGSLWLGLTGREGVKQFIQADGASWIRRVRSFANDRYSISP